MVGGAPPNSVPDGTPPPLTAAASEAQMEVVRLLLERGALPNGRDGKSWLPLVGAAQSGDPETVRELVVMRTRGRAHDTGRYTMYMRRSWMWAVPALLALLASNASSASTAPAGWWLSGSHPKDYTTGTTKDAGREGACAFLASGAEGSDGFGTLMQTFSAQQYLGKRVRMKGFVKAESVEGWAGLWMRVDGTERASLSFDNMGERPIKGTLAWQRYEVVLDVPAESASISFGILLHGKGKVYLDDMSFEEVDRSVPTTEIAKTFPSVPMNLAFEQ